VFGALMEHAMHKHIIQVAGLAVVVFGVTLLGQGQEAQRPAAPSPAID